MKTLLFRTLFCLFILTSILLASCSIAPENSGPTLEVSEERSKPSWLSEEPLIIAGNWDTAHIFRTRKGSNPLWHEHDYRLEHSEEAIARLKDVGVSMAVIHFYKGFGMEAEKEQLQDAIELAALCRKQGIRVGVYVGSTIGYETFLLEQPEAVDWFIPDFMGRPVRYSRTQTFRKRPTSCIPGSLTT